MDQEHSPLSLRDGQTGPSIEQLSRAHIHASTDTGPTSLRPAFYPNVDVMLDQDSLFLALSNASSTAASTAF
jgi:hypothetical protein